MDFSHDYQANSVDGYSFYKLNIKILNLYTSRENFNLQTEFKKVFNVKKTRHKRQLYLKLNIKLKI